MEIVGMLAGIGHILASIYAMALLWRGGYWNVRRAAWIFVAASLCCFVAFTAYLWNNEDAEFSLFALATTAMATGITFGRLSTMDKPKTQADIIAAETARIVAELEASYPIHDPLEEVEKAYRYPL
jgi:hypothetical protein